MGRHASRDRVVAPDVNAPFLASNTLSYADATITLSVCGCNMLMVTRAELG